MTPNIEEKRVTQLSEHFSLRELTFSSTASRAHIDNTPSIVAMMNLQRTARGMEQVRSLLGSKPIKINSGYRSPVVNALVNGSRNSAHMTGHAVDFVCPEFGTPLEICRFLAQQPGLAFDQLIQEGTWVHIAFGPKLRHQLLTKSGDGFTQGITNAV